jgi:hypothetical protein
MVWRELIGLPPGVCRRFIDKHVRCAKQATEQDGVNRNTLHDLFVKYTLTEHCTGCYHPQRSMHRARVNIPVAAVLSSIHFDILH